MPEPRSSSPAWSPAAPAIASKVPVVALHHHGCPRGLHASDSAGQCTWRAMVSTTADAAQGVPALTSAKPPLHSTAGMRGSLLSCSHVGRRQELFGGCPSLLRVGRPKLRAGCSSAGPGQIAGLRALGSALPAAPGQSAAGGHRVPKWSPGLVQCLLGRQARSQAPFKASRAAQSAGRSRAERDACATSAVGRRPTCSTAQPERPAPRRAPLQSRSTTHSDATSRCPCGAHLEQHCCRPRRVESLSSTREAVTSQCCCEGKPAQSRAGRAWLQIAAVHHAPGRLAWCVAARRRGRARPRVWTPDAGAHPLSERGRLGRQGAWHDGVASY